MKQRAFSSYRGYLFLGLLLFWSWKSTAAVAQEDVEHTLDLSVLIQEASENNPEIKAARQRWEAAKAVIPQVKTLPDPRLNFGYQDVLEREAMYGFSQEIPFPLTDNMMVISPERLQSIGVKFEIAERRPLERTIRTVGQVEVDERRLAHVNIKIEGWIDELYVNYTGERVKKGQLLLTVYRPDLVATQQEYLLALKSRQTLGGSEFPEVAEGARSLLEVTRQRLQFWDIPEHQIRDLERTGKVLKALHIHSPITGTVIKKVALAGMHVNPGDELYTIADLSRIWIVADIYEYELPLIKVGQTATVILSYDPGTVLQGRVAFIYPTLDPQTCTAKVRFELDNPGEQLKPDMYTNVELRIPLGTRLAIPKEAVLESGERQVIFIHHGGGTLEWRNVKLGLRSGDWVEVVEGLSEGDHIVTSANFLIDSESRLKAAVSGMHGAQH